MRTKTVRELGGEIWAELSSRIPEETITWSIKNDLIDLIMGVLARHDGITIENDPDDPVTPTTATFKR